MIVQDSELMPTSLTEIFKNSDQRKHILKIIIQTLYNLGYEQSAAELEAQSKITYLTPEIKAIKSALPQQKYDEVHKILANTSKYERVRDVLNQLKCMKLIREGKMQEALLFIQNDIRDTKKQEQLSEELMMGTGQITPEILKKKHHYILETCFDCEISPNSMFKMINCYVELEKRGLTSGISPEFSLLKQPSALRGPPMRVIQTVSSLHLKTISFIKFNRNSTKVLTVSSHKKQKYITIWNLNKQKAALIEAKNGTFTIEEQVSNVSWNYDPACQLFAIATCSHIWVLSWDLSIKNSIRIPTGLHHSNRILCLNWNPLTNFLYVGGAFENIKVYGVTLQQIVTIQPFIRTRNLYFNLEGTHMYAISATKGLFSYYNLFENKEQSQYITEDSITSFRLENKDKNIVLVTEKKILYLAVERNKYTTLFSFNNNFSQNGLVEIQAFLFYPWIVCLGQKQFQAYGLEKDVSKQQKWSSKDSFTFDIADNYMVSGSKQLYLWGSRSFRDDIESEKEQQAISVKQTRKNGHGPQNQNDQSQEASSQLEGLEEQEEHESLMEVEDSQMQEF